MVILYNYNWDMLVTVSLPDFNFKKQICYSWTFHVDECSKSSSTYDMIIGKVPRLGESDVIMNLNNQTVTWDTETIPIKDRDTCTLSSAEALIEFYLSKSEPQTLRYEYSWAIKILDAQYKQSSATLDDVIKTCENLHVEE
jgi:hypothetical protein